MPERRGSEASAHAPQWQVGSQAQFSAQFEFPAHRPSWEEVEGTRARPHNGSPHGSPVGQPPAGSLPFEPSSSVRGPVVRGKLMPASPGSGVKKRAMKTRAGHKLQQQGVHDWWAYLLEDDMSPEEAVVELRRRLAQGVHPNPCTLHCTHAYVCGSPCRAGVL